ncbi:hydroxymethylpyrimidine/phosphomethylpyrimidine kinase [Flavobacteriaceae bacterium R38]|nr:hydroxymethylpyrimidine/phosphomethylpyrimidine kinase [Flavobacteriaceae bacterium R38]
MKQRPNVLTIAGFDPSAGAGILADIKTLETLKCYGFAVCTANTVQNDVSFESCIWTEEKEIKAQIAILLDRFKVDVVKIGVIKNWKLLNEIIDFLLERNDKLKVVVDPVISSSTHFEFHESSAKSSENEFDKMLKKIYLLTPNYNEIERLYNDKTLEESIQHISGMTNLFLKGGHKKEMIGVDELFTVGGKRFVLNPKGKNISEKHGSGCVLSSAIAGYLALGFSLLKACYRGKRYTEKVLSSNNSLLGYHKF